MLEGGGPKTVDEIAISLSIGSIDATGILDAMYASSEVERRYIISAEDGITQYVEYRLPPEKLPVRIGPGGAGR